jgi:Protein of unknown function (DUF2889)
MPLSPPADREVMHTRRIVITGYRRADGLYDIEARLTDTKAYGFPNTDRGFVAPDEPIHDMWLRLTVDEEMWVVAAEAVSDATPYAICPTAAPNFAALAGLRIAPGFIREANARVRGTIGCTHLRELLQQVATTAFQTIGPARARRDLANAESTDGEKLDARTTERLGGVPRILNTCVAYGTESPVVKRRWPELYTGPEAAV